MRVLIWHGWLLEGSGSNVYAAKTAEALRRAGHDVVVLCQEPRPDRFGFVDQWGRVSGRGVEDVRATGAPPASGNAVFLRPEIGPILPVFVVDEYEGFEVKRFVELSEEELDRYLRLNVDALRAALEWRGADAIVTGHAIPGAPVARRAVGPGTYVAKIHGSDLEYAVRAQDRYLELAREGLAEARAVVGASTDVLERAFALVPEARPLGRVVTPGVDVARFHPAPRKEALAETAAALEQDPDLSRGRAPEIQLRMREALEARDDDRLGELAGSYDQDVADRSCPEALRALAETDGRVVGYFGKLIPQKGIHLLLQAMSLLPDSVHGLVVGFGGFREWLQAFLIALDEGDVEAARWIADRSSIQLELSPEEIEGGAGLASRVWFTGKLDHRYAPGALAAMDVLVVPSVLEEAFGMVAAEGAASGALPLVANHSGLAEIARALEAAVGREGIFSFEPGPGAARRIAESVERVLVIPDEELRILRDRVHRFAASNWSWEHTAESLLDAAAPKTAQSEYP